jgi:uncharacterized low-complexity protein
MMQGQCGEGKCRKKKRSITGIDADTEHGRGKCLAKWRNKRRKYLIQKGVCWKVRVEPVFV